MGGYFFIINIMIIILNEVHSESVRPQISDLIPPLKS